MFEHVFIIVNYVDIEVDLQENYLVNDHVNQEPINQVFVIEDDQKLG